MKNFIRKKLIIVAVAMIVNIVLFWHKVINCQDINGYISCNIVYGNNLGIIASTSSNVDKISSVSYANENGENRISELNLDERYSIGGVDFHFEDIYYEGTKTDKKSMRFDNVEYEYNEYRVLGPVLRLNINGNDNYILWTHYWDSDVRVCEVLELKDRKINVYWLTSGTYGELIAYKDNVITFKEGIATDLGHDGADVISNYEIRDDGIFQVGDYKIENCDYISIGHKLPAHILFKGEDREILILKGEKIRFTHSDFESKLYFENENGVEGYLVVSRNDEYEMLWILSELKVNGVVLDEYFQGRIDDLARLGISKW